MRDSSHRVRKSDLLAHTHIGYKIRCSYMGSTAYHRQGKQTPPTAVPNVPRTKKNCFTKMNESRAQKLQVTSTSAITIFMIREIHHHRHHHHRLTFVSVGFFVLFVVFSCAPDPCQICRVILSPLARFSSESFFKISPQTTRNSHLKLHLGVILMAFFQAQTSIGINGEKTILLGGSKVGNSHVCDWALNFQHARSVSARFSDVPICAGCQIMASNAMPRIH